jgi:hypothetical protein
MKRPLATIEEVLELRPELRGPPREAALEEAK